MTLLEGITNDDYVELGELADGDETVASLIAKVLVAILDHLEEDGNDGPGEID